MILLPPCNSLVTEQYLTQALNGQAIECREPRPEGLQTEFSFGYGIILLCVPSYRVFRWANRGNGLLEMEMP